MKAVVHARREAQGHITATHERLGQGLGPVVVAQQIAQAVRKALGLQHLRAVAGTAVFNGAMRSHDAVTGAGQHIGSCIHRPGTGLEFAGEAIMQAVEPGFFCITQVQVGKSGPCRHGQLAYPRVADAAPPSHEVREADARHPVGQQEVEVLVEDDALQRVAQIHGDVMWLK